jgi:hypothetical protein
MRNKNNLSKNILFGLLLITFLLMGSDVEPTFKPKDGYVPDAETAKRIAEAVWIPIYGAQRIEQEKPFQARLMNGNIWHVEGSMKQPNEGDNIVVEGGVAMAEIAKDDGRILRVIHGK